MKRRDSRGRFVRRTKKSRRHRGKGPKFEAVKRFAKRVLNAGLKSSLGKEGVAKLVAY